MVHKMAIKGHYGERGVRLLSPLCCLQMVSYFVGWGGLGGGGGGNPCLVLLFFQACFGLIVNVAKSAIFQVGEDVSGQSSQLLG